MERERLGEHVRVMSKKLRGAEEAARESELALREERRRTAHLVNTQPNRNIIVNVLNRF